MQLIFQTKQNCFPGNDKFPFHSKEGILKQLEHVSSFSVFV